jgi:hypothetical protein
MSIREFVPEIWSTNLLVALRKQLIFAGPSVVNRNYEGEIANAGDTVRITTIGRPSIGDYVPNSTSIVPQALQTAQRTLVIDQAKYWAFEVDDVDARQAMGNFITESMSEAAYALADVVDQYVAALYTGIPSVNQVADVAVDLDANGSGDVTKVYDNMLVPLKVRLDELNVPQQGRYVTVPPVVHGVLLRDGRFIKANESADASALRNGFVGRAAGFDIMMSNNCPAVSITDGGNTFDGNVCQAGTNAAITFAEQINKTEAYRPQSSFSDAVKGLSLYGAKLIRPDSLTYCQVAVKPAAI